MGVSPYDECYFSRELIDLGSISCDFVLEGLPVGYQCYLQPNKIL